ncbi:MAG: peptidylprolyl isomerase, partial [Campylobacterota bacterium]|nr:peptidylprolyl isomerase [Campylobacterota bacterium]
MEDEAKALLVKLQEESNSIDMQRVGDSFLHGTAFAELKEFELKRLFGKAFAKTLLEQETGKWQGPLTSGYGLHLVYVDAKTASKTASLEIAKQSVLEDWTTDERKKVNDTFVSNLRKEYDVQISKPSTALLPQKLSE